MSNSVPSPLTSFVGREREVEQIYALLRRDDVRLLTLTGPGGVGKTRLALAVAEAITPEYANGVRFVSLAVVRDHRLVASILSRAVGVHESSSLPFVDHLRAAARDTEALLLIDNFEHLLPAAPLLTEVLAACPHITLLVTSRERLRVSGERDEPVLPLVYPDPERLPASPQLVASPAVRLFVERAQAVDPGFAVTEATASAVAAICHRLDGLPLALELAAARSPHLPPAALLARLARRLPLLTSGPRDVPARLQTMRDAILWSYDLLTPAEQVLFRRLAVFAGGFTLAAAEIVGLTDSTATLPSILDGIASLVDKSLVQRAEAPGNEPRFYLLETIREFGLERLAMAGEEDVVRAAHAAYYLALTESTASLESGETVGFDRLTGELANIRVALDWLSSAGSHGDALRLTMMLGRFWLRRGHQLEGRDWLQRALAAALEEAPQLRSVAWYALGELDRELGNRVDAMHAYEQALDLARSVEDRAGVARALDGLAVLSDEVADDATTKALSEDSAAIWRELGDRRGLARALHNLAWAETGMGNYDGASNLFEEALDLALAIQDDRGVAHTLNSLGHLRELQGRRLEARALLEESLMAARAFRDPPEIAAILADLGMLTFELGDLSSARAYLAESLGLLHGTERGRTAVFAIEACALVADTNGDHDLAVRLAFDTAMVRKEVDLPIERDSRLVDAPRAAIRQALIQLTASAEYAGRGRPFDETLREAQSYASPPSLADNIGDPLDPLSPREREVLGLLAEGRTDQQIADELFISRRTASKHVSAILDKLDATNRTEAAALLPRESQPQNA